MRNREHSCEIPKYLSSTGQVPSKLARVQHVSKSIQFEVGKSIRGYLEQCKSKETTTTPSFKIGSLDQNPSSRSPSLEYLVPKYVNSVNLGVKNMEEVQRSITTSLQNMEDQMGKLTMIIFESPPETKSNEDAKMITLRRGKELIKTPILNVEKGKRRRGRRGGRGKRLKHKWSPLSPRKTRFNKKK